MAIVLKRAAAGPLLSKQCSTSSTLIPCRPGNVQQHQRRRVTPPKAAGSAAAAVPPPDPSALKVPGLPQSDTEEEREAWRRKVRLVRGAWAIRASQPAELALLLFARDERPSACADPQAPLAP